MPVVVGACRSEQRLEDMEQEQVKDDEITQEEMRESFFVSLRDHIFTRFNDDIYRQLCVEEVDAYLKSVDSGLYFVNEDFRQIVEANAHDLVDARATNNHEKHREVMRAWRESQDTVSRAELDKEVSAIGNWIFANQMTAADHHARLARHVRHFNLMLIIMLALLGWWSSKDNQRIKALENPAAVTGAK